MICLQVIKRIAKDSQLVYTMRWCEVLSVDDNWATYLVPPVDTLRFVMHGCRSPLLQLWQLVARA